MNISPAAKRHSWFALCGLMVATAASAPFFIGTWNLAEDLHVREAVTVVGDPSEPLADASTSPELAPLLSYASNFEALDSSASASQSADAGPSSLESLAGDRGTAGGGNTNEGFATGAPFGGGNAATAVRPPPMSGGAMIPRIGGDRGAPSTAAIAADADPSSTTGRSIQPDRRITRSPRTDSLADVVAGVGSNQTTPAPQTRQGSSPASTPAAQRPQASAPPVRDDLRPDPSTDSIAPPAISALLPRHTPDVINTYSPSLPGQMPGVTDPHTSLLPRAPDVIETYAALVPGQTPDVIAAYTPSTPGQTPDLIAAYAPPTPGQTPNSADTPGGLAFESPVPSGVLLEEIPQSIPSAPNANTSPAAGTSPSDVSTDLPGASSSAQPEALNQVPEPGTLALLGLSLFGGLRFARRKH